MKLHELSPAEGSKHARKRVGRGPGSGIGKARTSRNMVVRDTSADSSARASRNMVVRDTSAAT